MIVYMLGMITICACSMFIVYIRWVTARENIDMMPNNTHDNVNIGTDVSSSATSIGESTIYSSDSPIYE